MATGPEITVLRPDPPGIRKVLGGLGRLVRWSVDHWLLLVNALAALTLFGALASPIVRAAGLEPAAAWIDGLYRYIRLQRPSHSFFLLRHQVSLDQRMLAMAAAQLVGGLLYAKARGHLPPLDWRLFVLGFPPATVGDQAQDGRLRSLLHAPWDRGRVVAAGTGRDCGPPATLD